MIDGSFEILQTPTKDLTEEYFPSVPAYYLFREHIEVYQYNNLNLLQIDI